MNNTPIEQLNLEELCQATLITTEIVIEIVEHGIIEPDGNTPENWRFNAYMVTTARKALRLHNDLDVDWPGVALALSLIDELEQLRGQNKALKQRLSRFE